MFSELSEKLESALKRIRGHGKIREKNVSEALKDVRLALLEADVNYKVVKRFTEDVKAKALGEQVLTSVTPGQQFVKIVFEELRDIMGEGSKEITCAPDPPTKILVVGLQGSGKTTACAKIARRFKSKGRKGLLVVRYIHCMSPYFANTMGLNRTYSSRVSTTTRMPAKRAPCDPVRSRLPFCSNVTG